MATYQWYWGTTASNATNLISGAMSSSYTPTTADVGMYLRVVATGTDNYTGEVGHTLTSAVIVPLPSAPTGLTGTPATNSVALSWTASDWAATYRIERSLDGDVWDEIADEITTASYTDDTITPDTVYHYRVFAVNATGFSTKSDVFETKTLLFPATALDKPVLERVGNADKHHTIKAEWTPGTNNANALSYEIRVYSDSSLTTRVHTEPADKNLTELEFAVNGLGAGTYYVVAVAIGDAVNFVLLLTRHRMQNRLR